MANVDRSMLARVVKAVASRIEKLGIKTTVIDLANANGNQHTHSLRIGSDVALTFAFSSDKLFAVDESSFAAATQITDDVWQLESMQTTVGQLAERIEQAYEQAHLLFRLAKIPEDPIACVPGLKDAVERLHGITKFGWVALRFVEDSPAVTTLRGKQMISGAPTIDAGTFDRLLSEAVHQDRGPDANVIARTDECELAAATGAEVLLQPLTFDGQRLGILAAGNNGGSDSGLSSFETQLFAACAGYLDTFHANVARIAQQEAMFLGTLRALTASIDAKDPYTRGHSERVALLAHDMALAIGKSEAEAERFRIAGLIHDIGKIGVPESTLCKAGKLTDEEFGHIKKHPQIGFDILRDIPGLNDVLPGVLHHHERFDGRGYPYQIAGEAIPLLARVLALADTFDAMSSNRSYRSKLPREQVLAELMKCAGAQFDPQLAPVFVQMDFTRFDQALWSHADSFPAPIVAPVALAA